MERTVERDLSDPMVGRLLDRRYRIGPRIARGGMASVYEAIDVRLDRTVAIKVMHPGMGDDEEFAARFVREARHAARLSHPNVVGVFDQGEEDGTVYLAMEYVPGHTLRDVIRKESPMPPGKALALVEPVLSALAAAHRAGLIHRDIKPENVLISGDGRVKVADFGLAKAVSADTQHTATGGILIGTVSYLAPELVVDGRADARADVYAAGVVLYELLTGRKPHEGESPIQVAYKHVHEDVPAPSTLVPGLPAYVDALVARATARDRSHRPADARVLLHQVHRVKQALDEGVVEDPELVSDLAPPLAVVTMDPDVEEAYDAEEVAERLREVDPPEDTDPIRPAAAAPAGATPVTAGHRIDDTSTIDPGLVRAPRPPAPTEPASYAAWDEPPRRSRRGLVMLLVALLLAVGAGVGAWYFGFARYTSTPGVLGLTSAQAETRLERAGLGFEVGDEAYSETVPAGRIISTDPDPGDRVLDGGTVTGVVSLGLERYDVPKLRGKTEDEAQQAIQDTHLEFGRSIPTYSEKVPEGRVITTNPEPGTSVKPGATVDILLSRGPKPIKVTDWTGKEADKAQAALEKQGLVVTRSEDFSDSVDEGDVIAQVPSTGTVFKGDEVKLTVSKGPELVDVPLVRGQGVESATTELEDAGFEVEVRHHADYIGLGWVLQQSPGSGDKAPAGSTVVITVV
ncbi:Stk1 family PASTA domain-containing Ser/Thr kinase [Nocardioides guangzhouensis]|uniref:Stk1 family PASTA domain-containing Ser/Thr kinase n=1 Tax=Nocardioides guangzhouensis TaxID=2497878 RepID=UPI001FE69B34|nr:Stk1 family PASTA domain-containing Ser/Thr kinase [Nocardioides guangzhouensis]